MVYKVLFQSNIEEVEKFFKINYGEKSILLKKELSSDTFLYGVHNPEKAAMSYKQPRIWYIFKLRKIGYMMFSPTKKQMNDILLSQEIFWKNAHNINGEYC